MTTTLLERPSDLGAGNGGGPARRAVVRWAWRLFRREWRQQILVLALLTVSVAATTIGEAVATEASKAPQTIVTLPASDAQLAADIAAFQTRFGHVEVITHEKVAVPGSVATIDLRAEDARSSWHPSLRLLAGRYPTGATEVAVTRGVGTIFNLRIGQTWNEGGRALQVVGVVENPLNLNDQFGLVAPGQLNAPSTVTVLPSGGQSLNGIRLPSHTPLVVESGASTKASAAAAVLALSTILLLFVGLVAVAGFTVMAQRRMRALGMLGSLGATDRHVRLVMLANGAVVGVTAAVAGAAVGLAGWVAFAPRLETIAEHRINRFDLPWWAIGTALVLAVVTAVGAAWWPARSASRISVVAALSGRPPRPHPAHRFAALGGLLVAAGLGLLALSHQRRPLLIVGGIVATTVGVLFLAPLAIRALTVAGRRSPVAVRLAVRDLARYQARSGAALGAVSLAVGIAAAIAISAATQAATDTTTQRNLPVNQVLVHLAAGGGGAPIPPQSPAQLHALQTQVDAIAASLHTQDVVALDAAINPNAPELPGPGNGQNGNEPIALVAVSQTGRGYEERFVGSLYVATPAVLAHYGIAAVDPTTDILTSRTDMAGLQVGGGPLRTPSTPTVQRANLPRGTSDPNALITIRALATLGLQPLPAGWLVQTAHPLTGQQVNAARQIAAAAGLTIETTSSQKSLAQLRNWATAIGLLLALGVLAMTVGLIRSETANDLRILTATGADGTTRRTLTGATAGAMALLGGVLGTAGAYAALLVWHRSDLTGLGHPPISNLAVIIVGFPLAAATAGWLLAGREPPAIARRPLE